MKFEPIIELPCLVSAVWRRFGVHIFEGHVSVETMDEIDRRGEAWFARHPGKLVEMVVIIPTEARMSSEERTRMARVVKRRANDRTASATVILATGLLGAAHRSVLTGLQFIAPPPHPTKVFHATTDAIDWLAPHIEALCGPEATRPALRSAVDELFASFRAKNAARSRAPA